MNPNEHIIIVGGGLSGLCLAYFLKHKNIETTILEASPRLGGRIQTQIGRLGTPLELGATWFSEFHEKFTTLLSELGLQRYAQFSEGKSLFETKSFEPPQEFYVPASKEPSYRLKGGTESIIDSLASGLSKDRIHLHTSVRSIIEQKNYLEVQTKDGSIFKGQKVVLCLPPQLVGSDIEFSPELPDELQRLLPMVQTWMAGSIKFTLEYRQPFWRQTAYSGMLFSHVGIITEMYDHTNYEEDKYGFTGFLNGTAAIYTQDERKEYALQQLSKLLGPEARNIVGYYDKVWTDSYILGNNKPVPRPHFNNGNRLLHKSYLSGKLLFSGTETDQEYPGYMEGAVRSAARTFEQIIEIDKK
ncbi:MAG: FAD-dependent oxidoreductase [Bacteroidota bacterium]